MKLPWIEISPDVETKEQLKRIELQLSTVIAYLTNITIKENIMSVAMDNLTAAVARIDGVVPSAVAAFQGLAAQIADLIQQIANLSPEDAAKIQGLADELNFRADELAAAVPAAPNPEIPVE